MCPQTHCCRTTSKMQLTLQGNIVLQEKECIWPSKKQQFAGTGSSPWKLAEACARHVCLWSSCIATSGVVECY